MKGPGLIAKTYDASVFPALLFPPKGPNPIPATAMSSRLPPTNARRAGGGGNSNSLFPLTHREKQTLARQTKKNRVLSGRVPKHYNTRGAVL